MIAHLLTKGPCGLDRDTTNNRVSTGDFSDDAPGWQSNSCCFSAQAANWGTATHGGLCLPPASKTDAALFHHTTHTALIISHCCQPGHTQAARGRRSTPTTQTQHKTTHVKQTPTPAPHRLHCKKASGGGGCSSPPRMSSSDTSTR